MNQSDKGKPQTKIKSRGFGRYGVYKKVGIDWVLKKTFYSLHQARRYQKGFKK